MVLDDGTQQIMELHALEGSVLSIPNTSADMTSTYSDLDDDVDLVPRGSSTPKSGGTSLPCMVSDEVTVASHETVNTIRIKCSTCNYSTSDRSNMNRHERIHTGERTKCNDCDRSFNDKYELRHHIQSIHQGQTLMCDTCGKQYNSRQALWAHSQRCHPTKDPKWACQICQQTFQQKSHYVGHINKHHDSKPYSCSVCNAQFSYKSHQQRHEKTCRGATQVVCDICKNTYSTPQILREHTVAKHSMTKFDCACGKSYNWKRSLSRHQNSCPIGAKNVQQ